MYEFTANGSLDGFLKDESKRADLPAATRLSIMYEVARVVHFLHSGGAGLKVFHRDIKSGNIHLTKNFTPRLIDCGLAKFVEDKRNAFSSETTDQTGSPEGPAAGTIGYMCPEYASRKADQNESDYIPAYDVYSLGVVMAELILGHLNGDPTNIFESYVVNGETPIVDGWQQLINDADGQADWNAGALELISKTAIGCITPSSEGRLSTGVLLSRLHRAITVDAGETGFALLGGGIADDVIAMLTTIKSGEGDSDSTFNAEVNYAVRGEILSTLTNSRSQTNSGRFVVPRELIDDLRATARPMKSVQGSSDPDGTDHVTLCSNCNERTHVVKCKGESHPLCADCIDAQVRQAPFSTAENFKLNCPKRRCRSQPYTHDDLKKHIDIQVWIDHMQKENREGFSALKEANDILLEAQALHNAYVQQFDVCPTVVVITRIKDDRSKDLKTWFKKLGKQKYEVTFYCERSGNPGHKPFEISVEKQWFVDVAPWLRVLVNIAAESDPLKVSSNVLKEFPLFRKHSEEMKALIKVLEDEENRDKKHTLVGDALKAMASMANKHESHWRTKMKLKLENGRSIWVKKVDDVSHDDSTEICA